jgi:predicted GNAT superfamily acetyltransferase
VTWDLRSPRAVAASRFDPLPSANGSAEAQVLLQADQHGRPRTRQPSAERYRVMIPADIVALRRRDVRLAREWRLAVRDTLGAAVRDGLRATVVGRDACYLLTAGTTDRRRHEPTHQERQP